MSAIATDAVFFEVRPPMLPVYRAVPMMTAPLVQPPRVFRRVLVAVDASPQSLWAVDVGRAIASTLGAQLGVVHVADLNAAWAPGLRYNVVMGLENEGEMLLARMARHAAGDDVIRSPGGHTPVVTMLREGDPAREIVAAANEWDADLVVLGTHTRGVKVRIFPLGTVADQVLRHAPCPVMTVGQEHAPNGHDHPCPDDRAGCLGEQFVG